MKSFLYRLIEVAVLFSICAFGLFVWFHGRAIDSSISEWFRDAAFVLFISSMVLIFFLQAVDFRQKLAESRAWYKHLHSLTDSIEGDPLNLLRIEKEKQLLFEKQIDKGNDFAASRRWVPLVIGLGFLLITILSLTQFGGIISGGIVMVSLLCFLHYRLSKQGFIFIAPRCTNCQKYIFYLLEAPSTWQKACCPQCGTRGSFNMNQSLMGVLSGECNYCHLQIEARYRGWNAIVYRHCMRCGFLVSQTGVRKSPLTGRWGKVS